MATEIKLYDVIGEWGDTAKGLVSLIPADETDVTVRINSPGGNVSDGLAIYHYLKDHKAKVTTIVDGYAASAASIVMLAGEIRVVHKASIIMIHEPWSIAAGNAGDMRHSAEVLDEHTQALLDIYESETGTPRAEIEKMLEDETWMRGEAALDYGFATMLIDDDKQDTKQAAASLPYAQLFAALTEGKEIVSRQKTRKEIEAELEAAEAAKAKAEADAVAQIESAKTEASAALELIKSELESAKAQADELAKSQEAIKAEIESIKAEAEAAKADLEAKKAELADLESKSAAALAAIKNPAFADAAIAATTSGDLPAIESELDRAEAELAKNAASGETPNDPKSEMEAWESMPQGAERTAYWSKHKKAIFRQMEAREKKGDA